MRVAVIGASGQLGSDLVKAFGDEAVSLTHSDIEVRNSSSCRKALVKHSPDVAVNCAAYVRVDDAEDEAEEAFAVNAVGAKNVAEACEKIGAVNVYISTDYVFDGTKGEPYTEDDIPNPINAYGLSKLAGEIFTRNYSSKHYIIRVSSLYGEKRARGKGGNFVDTIIRKAENREEIRVVDDMFMSPTYTKDSTEVLREFLEVRPSYGIYHMVNEGYCNWYELTKEIFDALGWDVPLTAIKSEELNRVAKRPAFSVLENRWIADVGLRMRSWQESLRDYLSGR